MSLPLLFLSVMLARLGCCAGRLRSHYLWIAGAFAVAAFGRLLHLPHAVATPLSDLLIGGGIVVAALGDHRVLRRTLTLHPRDGGLS